MQKTLFWGICKSTTTAHDRKSLSDLIEQKAAKIVPACGNGKVFFVESTELFREMGDTHRLAQTLNHQGQDSLALNNIFAAKDALTTALRLAHEGGLLPPVLYALAGLTALETRERASQTTLGLVMHVLQHQARAQETEWLGSKRLDEFIVQSLDSA